MNQYNDPILQLIADLRTVICNSTDEIINLRQMLNEQNASMIEMKNEIIKLESDKFELNSKISGWILEQSKS